jgi:hypothetical protein
VPGEAVKKPAWLYDFSANIRARVEGVFPALRQSLSLAFGPFARLACGCGRVDVSDQDGGDGDGQGELGVGPDGLNRGSRNTAAPKEWSASDATWERASQVALIVLAVIGMV